MAHQPIADRNFHDVLRICISGQRPPTPVEVDQVAAKIWQDSFAAVAGMGWAAVPPNSPAHARTVRAAFGALGMAA